MVLEGQGGGKVTGKDGVAVDLVPGQMAIVQQDGKPTKVVEVKVPVSVPCVVEKVEEPVYPTAQGSTLFERVKVLLAEIELRKGYEAKLKATVAGCGEVK